MSNCHCNDSIVSYINRTIICSFLVSKITIADSTSRWAEALREISFDMFFLLHSLHEKDSTQTPPKPNGRLHVSDLRGCVSLYKEKGDEPRTRAIPPILPEWSVSKITNLGQRSFLHKKICCCREHFFFEHRCRELRYDSFICHPKCRPLRTRWPARWDCWSLYALLLALVTRGVLRSPSCRIPIRDMGQYLSD